MFLPSRLEWQDFFEVRLRYRWRLEEEGLKELLKGVPQHFFDKSLPGEKVPAKIRCDMMSSSGRKLSGGSMVVVSQDQVSCELGGEAAILNLKAGVYYGLNEVGARIWKLIQEPKRVSEIRDTILEEYEVEPDQCEVDVIVLLQDLLDNGLIEEKNESIR